MIQKIIDWLLANFSLAAVGTILGILTYLGISPKSIRSHIPRVGRSKVIEEERPRKWDPLDWATKKLAETTKEKWEGEADRLGLLAGPGDGETAELATSLIRIDCAVDTTGTPIPVEAAATDALGAWRNNPRADHLADYFHDSPVKELVVLGSAEAGKSTAAILLTLGLLNKRTVDTQAVPVKFSLDYWDHDLSLADWLKQRLLEDHPGFRQTTKNYGADVVSHLLKEHRVLPILDGLDELPNKEERERVIKAINTRSRRLPGLILTCQQEVYAELDYKFKGAVVVTLAGVSIGEAQRYLKNATLGDARPERWQPVHDDLTKHKKGALALALASPLMVYLVPKVYEDPKSSPAELLNGKNRDDPEAIKEHLLQAYVLAVFPEVADRPGGQPWRGVDASRWLGFLAAQLEKTGSNSDVSATRFGWWDLSRYGRPATGIMAGVVGGLTAGAAVGLAFTALFNLVAGLVAGTVAALLLGLASWLNDPPKPSERQKLVTLRPSSILKSGLAIGVIVFIGGFLARDVYLGIFAGLGFGGPIAILYGLTEPDPTLRPLDADLLLRRDIRVGVTFGLTYGVPAGITGWFLSGDPILSTWVGIAAAVAGALLYGPIWIFAALAPVSGRLGKLKSVGLVAFAHLGIATVRFALPRKLPWHVMAFLDHAHDLGVLRMVSGSYEFRHRALQRVLAAEYDARLAKGPAKAADRASPSEAAVREK
jgi:hypothetical protein